MGRLMLKCGSCSRYFATGLNIAQNRDPRSDNKFSELSFRCTSCGSECEYSSRDLVDEGPELGSKDRRRGATQATKD